MRVAGFLLLFSIASFGAGCATVTGKSSDVIRLYTTPAYTQAVIDGKRIVGANSTIVVDRTIAHRIEFRKPGFVTQEIRISPEVNTWTYGNLAFGPAFFVGLVVDTISGDIMRLDTNDVRVTLRASPGAPLAKRATVPAYAARPKKDPLPLARTAAPPLDPSTIVAVMPLDVGAYTEIAPPTQTSLTEQLRVFLGVRGLRVIDRGTQDRALDEMLAQEQERSYSPCVDESCQVPLGRALAATHLLRSTIARFGRMCSTSAELIDLVQEVTVRAASTHGGCDDEALLDAAENVVAQLFPPARS